MTNYINNLLKTQHDKSVFKCLGLEVIKLDADETIINLKIDERHLQHRGLVHGGIYVLLAESAASIAAACTLTSQEYSVVATAINANHLRSTSSGSLSARSKSLRLGKRILVYDVDVKDNNEQLVSVARCTLMVIDSRNSQEQT